MVHKPILQQINELYLYVRGEPTIRIELSKMASYFTITIEWSHIDDYWQEDVKTIFVEDQKNTEFLTDIINRANEYYFDVTS